MSYNANTVFQPGTPGVDRRNYREGDTRTHGHLRSNGQPPAQIPERREIGDSFHGVSTMALMKELFRRFNDTP